MAELLARSSLVTAPTVEPLSLAEVKTHLRVQSEVTDEDGLLEGLIVAARNRAEMETGRALITQTWNVLLDRTPTCALVMPKPPLQRIVSVSYVDNAGATQTWSSSLYQVSLMSGDNADFGRLQPAYGQIWPIVRNQMDALTVQMTGGYGDTASTVPQAIRQAMLLMIGQWYEVSRSGILADVRMELLPLAADTLLRPYRVNLPRMS